EGNPSTCREADQSQTVSIDEGLASQEVESPVCIPPAHEEGFKRGRCAGVFYATRCIAVDEQDDVTPRDKFIGQPLPYGVMHPGTAMQSDDGGKRACAIGLGQIALDALARNVRNRPRRGAFNSTRSRGAAHASAIGAATTQQSISPIAAREGTVLGNGISL